MVKVTLPTVMFSLSTALFAWREAFGSNGCNHVSDKYNREVKFKSYKYDLNLTSLL